MAKKLLILKLAILSLAFTWLLDNWAFQKAGYVLWALLVAVYISFGVSRPPRLVSLYLCVIGGAFTLQAFFLELGWTPAILSMGAYFGIPLVASSITLNYRQLVSVLGILKYVALIYFIGLVVQLTGVGDGFFAFEQTTTSGITHQRYTSLSGGTILFGAISFLTIVALLSEYIETQSPKTKTILLTILSMSVVSLYFSYTRRFYILSLMAVAYFLYLEFAHNKSRNKFLIYVFLPMSILSLIVSEVFWDSVFSSRLISSLDLEEVGGNEIRILLWLRAIDSIVANPFLGLGVGSEGTIGKSVEQVLEYLFVDAPIIDMYYLQVAVDFGVFVGLFFLIWVIFTVRVSFKRSTKRMFLYRTVPLLFALESFIGTELVSPLFAFVFWLVLAQMLRLERKRPTGSSLGKRVMRDKVFAPNEPERSGAA